MSQESLEIQPRHISERQANGCIPAASLALSGLDIYITSSCDRRCSHCFLTDDFLDSGQVMSIGMVDEIIAWSTEEPKSGIEEITLLGGEPSRHPKFTGIVAAVHAAGLRVRVVTNGNAVFRNKLDSIPNFSNLLTSVSVSLDAPDQEAHDAIRGHGSFYAATTTIKALQAHGVPFEINTTILRDNVPKTERMIELAETYGARRLNVHWPSLAGRARLHASHQIPTAEEWLAVITTVKKYRSYGNVVVDCELGFAYGLPGEDLSMCKVRDRSNLQIYPDGSALLCGMLADDPTKSAYIWQNGSLTLRNDPQDEAALTSDISCKGCPLRQESGGLRPLCVYNRLG